MVTDIDEIITKIEKDFNSRKWYIKITDKVKWFFADTVLNYNNFFARYKKSY